MTRFRQAEKGFGFGIRGTVVRENSLWNYSFCVCRSYSGLFEAANWVVQAAIAKILYGEMDKVTTATYRNSNLNRKLGIMEYGLQKHRIKEVHSNKDLIVTQNKTWLLV